MFRDEMKKAAEAFGLTLSETQLAQFTRYYELLVAWNEKMNLTAITEPEAVARLHFADCLTLLKAADLKNASVIDVGCGAGFPGVPLKLGEPTVRLTLLDSLQKRVHWLDETLKALGVEAQCVAARAEEFPARERYDFAVSRAVARLNVLSELCLPFVRVGGAFLAMKGAAAQEELEQARAGIARLGGRVEAVKTYEIGGAEHRVLLIRKVRPTPPCYPRRFAKIKQQPL